TPGQLAHDELALLPDGDQLDSVATEDEVPDASGPTYAQVWDELAREDTLRAAFGTGEEEECEAAGRFDAERLRQWAGPGSVVLDLGGGLGRVERYLAPHVGRVHLVDVSPAMLARARARLAGLANVELHEAEAGDLGMLEAGSIDFAFSLLTLQHLGREDAYRALRELARVLRPGG